MFAQAPPIDLSLNINHPNPTEPLTQVIDKFIHPFIRTRLQLITADRRTDTPIVIYLGKGHIDVKHIAWKQNRCFIHSCEIPSKEGYEQLVNTNVARQSSLH